MLHDEMHHILCWTLQLTDRDCSKVWAVTPGLYSDTVGMTLRRRFSSHDDKIVYDVQEAEAGTRHGINMGSTAAAFTYDGVGAAWEQHGLTLARSKPMVRTMDGWLGGLGWKKGRMESDILDCSGQELARMVINLDKLKEHGAPEQAGLGAGGVSRVIEEGGFNQGTSPVANQRSYDGGGYGNNFDDGTQSDVGEWVRQRLSSDFSQQHSTRPVQVAVLKSVMGTDVDVLQSALEGSLGSLFQLFDPDGKLVGIMIKEGVGVGGNWLLQVERRRDVDLRAVTMLAMTLNLAARQAQPSGTSGKDNPLRHLARPAARTVNPTATRDAASKSAGGGAEGGKHDDDLETAMQNVEDDFPVGFVVPLVFLFGALAVACCFRFMAQGNSKKHRTVYVDARPPNTSPPPRPAQMIVKNKSALPPPPPEPPAPGPPLPPRANKGEEMGVYTFIASQAVAPPKPPATPPSPIFATAHSRLHGGEGLVLTPRHPAVEQMLASVHTRTCFPEILVRC